MTAESAVLQVDPVQDAMGADKSRPNVAPLGVDEFERFALHHSERAWRYAFAFANDRQAADDLLQEALTRLFERRDAYPLRTHFGPYLVKTVARLAMDERRQRRAAERHAPIREQAKPKLQPLDPADHAQTLESHGQLAHAVAELPQRDRACLLLAVCEGLSYADIAAALNCNFSDVNNSIYRARTILRTRLADLKVSRSKPRAGHQPGDNA